MPIRTSFQPAVRMCLAINYGNQDRFVLNDILKSQVSTRQIVNGRQPGESSIHVFMGIFYVSIGGCLREEMTCFLAI